MSSVMSAPNNTLEATAQSLRAWVPSRCSAAAQRGRSADSGLGSASNEGDQHGSEANGGFPVSYPNCVSDHWCRSAGSRRKIGLYENVYDALKREVFEETGLRVIGFRPDVRTKTHSQKGDDVFAFVPFCCQQQLSGKARVGFVFVCTVDGTDPVPAPDEVKEITWMGTSELMRLIDESPERIFTFQLPVLEFYLHQCTEA